MNKIFVALLILSLCHTSVQAADKIRISTPGDAAHFTMHLAQKRGFLKEEGFDAEVIVISGPVANVALSNGDTDYFRGFGSALRAILQGLSLRIVACYRPTPHFMLQSRPEFKTVKDLKGKTIGVRAFGGGPDLVGRLIIKHFGLDPDKDVKWVGAGSDEGRYIRMQQRLLEASHTSPRLTWQEDGFSGHCQIGGSLHLSFQWPDDSHQKDQRETGRGQTNYSGGYQGQPLHARESRWNHPNTDEHL